jgi:hypothetical protein
MAMQALLFAWYNLCRKREAIQGQTPAMASGLSDHVWTIKELIEKAADAWTKLTAITSTLVSR